MPLNLPMADVIKTDVIKTDVVSSSVDERHRATSLSAKTLKSQLLGGSLTLLAGSGLVGVTNLVYNVVTARLLGPTGFAHATAVYTILMLISGITLSFQVVCAKYVARSASPEARSAVFASLHQRSWMAGIAIGLLLFLFERPLTGYLNLPDPVLIEPQPVEQSGAKARRLPGGDILLVRRE